jgi:ubiquitin carboxyl-terminal hydrolase 5/13
LTKVAHALLSDSYVPPQPPSQHGTEQMKENTEQGNDESLLEKYVIAPRMLKSCVAGQHREFSSGRQQDVTEYFIYFLEQMNRAERVHLNRLTNSASNSPGTDSIFNFSMELKFQDMHNPTDVKILNKGAQCLFNLLELPIPLDKAIPKPSEGKVNEENEVKRQKTGHEGKDGEDTKEQNFDDNHFVSFDSCLQKYFEPDMIEMRHPGTQVKGPFRKMQHFHTFPRYLMIKLSRYYVTENWCQKKINLEVPMPMELNLNQYRGQGLAPGEKEIVEGSSSSSSSSAAAAPFVINEELVQNLTMMGFSENGCRRAAVATNNADVETAMNWILEHMEDADFNSPPVLPASSSSATTTGGGGGGASLPEVNEESVMMLTSMGYSDEQCRGALIATDNNIER